MAAVKEHPQNEFGKKTLRKRARNNGGCRETLRIEFGTMAAVMKH